MHHPIIVLEGPDCSGKSTLADELAEHMNGHVIHATYRFKDRMFTYHTAVLEQALKIAQHMPVIIDRWWPSEPIYADAFRGGTPWPMLGRLLDRIALKHGILYVGCIPSDRERHLAMFEQKRAAGLELFDSVGKVALMYQGWDQRMEPRQDYIRYDMFSVEPDNLRHFVEYVAERAELVRKGVPDWFAEPQSRQWAGQPNKPLALFIGERSNPKGRHSVWPFFEHDNSSLWLTQLLANVVLREERLLWYNALNEEGFADPGFVDMMVSELKPQFVVCLGGMAKKVCKLATVKHDILLPHPAYAIRFLKGDKQPYYDAFNQMKRVAQ